MSDDIKISFGSIKETRIIDEHNSTMTETANFRKGQALLPIKRTYVIRNKVDTDAEVKQQYLKFFEDCLKDPKRLEPSFTSEKGMGPDKLPCYFTISSYTVLSYTSMYGIA